MACREVLRVGAAAGAAAVSSSAAAVQAARQWVVPSLALVTESRAHCQGVGQHCLLSSAEYNLDAYIESDARSCPAASAPTSPPTASASSSCPLPSLRAVGSLTSRKDGLTRLVSSRSSLLALSPFSIPQGRPMSTSTSHLLPSSTFSRSFAAIPTGQARSPQDGNGSDGTSFVPDAVVGGGNPIVDRRQKIEAVAEMICNMALIDVAELTEVLRIKLKIDSIPIAGAFAAGPAQGGAAADDGEGAADAEAAKPAEKTEFDVKLDKFDAASKIKVIKEVRAVTSLGLKEAKDLVEGAPAVLKTGVKKEEAEAIVEKLKSVGATCTIE